MCREDAIVGASGHQENRWEKEEGSERENTALPQARLLPSTVLT